MKLQGKVAIVTGASRGMGKEIALGLHREGATIVVASRKADALAEVVNEIKEDDGQAVAIPTHTGYAEQCQQLVEKTVEAFGRVDILVNNAATNPHFGPLLTSEASHWEKIIDVNLMGYYWVSKFAIEAMQKNNEGKGRGKIINLASVTGFNPGPMMGIYSISKAAVIMLTRVLAMELGADNIQVNAIAPGIIKTRFAQALWDNEELSKRYTDRTPAGRIGEPEEVVEAAIYLASSGSDYMTGQTLVLDGGNGIVGF
jgi:NAD(P)-dependent dehydrogenase (short-subunit alcohol dehydrogenase family)